MINNPVAFNRILPANFSGIFDWGYISKYLNKFGEDLGDIDARYHKKGWFLHFETKNDYHDDKLPKGYEISARDWIKQGRGYNTLMIVYAKDIRVQWVEIWKYNPNIYGRIDGIGHKHSCNHMGIVSFIDRFRENAIKNPKKW